MRRSPLRRERWCFATPDFVRSPASKSCSSVWRTRSSGCGTPSRSRARTLTPRSRTGRAPGAADSRSGGTCASTPMSSPVGASSTWRRVRHLRHLGDACRGGGRGRKRVDVFALAAIGLDVRANGYRVNVAGRDVLDGHRPMPTWSGRQLWFDAELARSVLPWLERARHRGSRSSSANLGGDRDQSKNWWNSPPTTSRPRQSSRTRANASDGPDSLGCHRAMIYRTRPSAGSHTRSDRESAGRWRDSRGHGPGEGSSPNTTFWTAGGGDLNWTVSANSRPMRQHLEKVRHPLSVHESHLGGRNSVSSMSANRSPGSTSTMTRASWSSAFRMSCHWPARASDVSPLRSFRSSRPGGPAGCPRAR